MLLYLRQQQLEKRWSHDLSSTEGVVLKRGRDDFICQPADLPKQVNGFFGEVKKLNIKVCPMGEICLAAYD